MKIRILASLVVVMFCASNASALLIDPAVSPWDSAPKLAATGTETSSSAISAIVDPIVDPSTEQYRQNQGGAETGNFASSYTTTFSNDPTDPMDADIVYEAGQEVMAATHLLVKDGNEGWYLFDIGGWDGVTKIELRNFWPGKGAISHVRLYGADPQGSGGIPEAGALSIWALVGMTALAIGRRRKRS